MHPGLPTETLDQFYASLDNVPINKSKWAKCQMKHCKSSFTLFVFLVIVSLREILENEPSSQLMRGNVTRDKVSKEMK